MKIILTATFTAVALLLGGCNSGVETRTADQRNSLGQLNLANQVYFDSFGTIPKVTTDSSYMIRLHNDSAAEYKIISAQLSPVVSGIDTIEASLDQNNCAELAAHTHCGFIVNYPANNTTSYILTAEVENSHHRHQIIKTALLAGAANPDKAGINYSLPASVASHGDNYHIGVPVYLTSDFTQISASDGILYCQNGYQRGNSCTYYNDGHITKDRLLISKLTATKADQTKVEVSSRSHLRASGFAHLLISAPQDIELDNENHVVRSAITVFNLGNQVASGFTLDPSELQAGVTVDTNTCRGEVAANATCKIILIINSARNGANTLKASYRDDSQQTKEFVYQFIHTVDISQPQLIWATSGDSFENTVLNEEREQQLTLTAKNITFDKITISKDSNSDFEIVGNQSTLCQGNQLSLDPATNDELCTISVKYKPQAPQITAMNFYFVASGTYTESNGISRTFAYPLAVSYSTPFSATDVISINNSAPITLTTTTDEPKEVSVQLSNRANYPIELSVPRFMQTIAGATIDPDQCNNFKLAKGATCTFIIRYAPTAVISSNTTQLSTSVVKFNGIAIAQNNQVTQMVNYSAQAPTTPNLSIRFVDVTGAATLNNGTYWLRVNSTINLNYEIKNTTANTRVKEITIAGLPSGWTVSSTLSNCYGNQLSHNNVCRITLSASYNSTGARTFRETGITINFKYANDNRGGTKDLGTRTTQIEVFNMPTIIQVGDHIGTITAIPGATTTTAFTLGSGGYPGMPAYTVSASSPNPAGLGGLNNTCSLNFTTRVCRIVITTDVSLSGSQRQVTFSSGLPLDKSVLQINFSILFNLGDAERPALFEAGTGSEANCVLDKLTGLMWPKAPVPGITGVTFSGSDWQRAFDLVKALNAGAGFCGHKDWFVPNINELMSLSNIKKGQIFPDWLSTNSGINFAMNNQFFSSTFAGLDSCPVALFMFHSTLVRSSCSEKGSNLIIARRKLSSVIYKIRQTGSTNTAGRNDTDGATQRGEQFVADHFEASTDPKCIVDKYTRKTWLRNNVNIVDGSRYSDIRVGVVNGYNQRRECGKTKWHVPNMHELLTLINYNFNLGDQATYLNRVGFDIKLRTNQNYTDIFSDTMFSPIAASTMTLSSGRGSGNLVAPSVTGSSSFSFDGTNMDFTFGNTSSYYVRSYLLVSD